MFIPFFMPRDTCPKPESEVLFLAAANTSILTFEVECKLQEDVVWTYNNQLQLWKYNFQNIGD